MKSTGFRSYSLVISTLISLNLSHLFKMYDISNINFILVLEYLSYPYGIWYQSIAEITTIAAAASTSAAAAAAATAVEAAASVVAAETAEAEPAAVSLQFKHRI